MSKSHETGPDQGMSGEHFPALIAIENLIGQTQENLALNDPAGYVLGYVSWTTNKFTALLIWGFLKGLQRYFIAIQIYR
jgi:hypothetical protein